MSRTDAVSKAEKRAIKALLKWWREDVKPRNPGEDNPACDGPPYHELWNAAKNLHHTLREHRKNPTRITSRMWKTS